MGNKLKDAFAETGPRILELPDLLSERMKEAGYSKRDILSVMLVLKCCPSVSTLLNQRQPDELEVNAMIRSAVMRTGLNVQSARRALGIILRACGYPMTYRPRLSLRELFVDWKILPEVQNELGDLFTMLEELDADPQQSELYSKLHNQAEAGNAIAAYKMGMLLKPADRKNNTSHGLRYFRRAARLGYAPANGAIADYLVHGSKPRFVRAADHLSNPAALCGSDGRQWIPVAEEVLKYRKENLKRHRSTLIAQCMLLLGILMIVLVTAQPDAWLRYAVAVQLAGVTWTLLSMSFRPCTSCVGASLSMMVSWLLVIFHL